MNKVEVGQLLTIASGFDRFITVDRVTTEAWFLALEHVDYAEAQAATVAHFTGPQAKETFAVRHILDAVAYSERKSPAQIAADVRSAKGRGLIGKGWPETDLLPEDVRDALFTIRDTERRAAKTRSDLEQSMVGRPADVGSVGRAVL